MEESFLASNIKLTSRVSFLRLACQVVALMSSDARGAY